VRRAQCGIAELRDALRHPIDMIVDLRTETVDHLTNGDELRAFQIPTWL
jgi:hypothetical protein